MLWQLYGPFSQVMVQRDIGMYDASRTQDNRAISY